MSKIAAIVITAAASYGAAAVVVHAAFDPPASAPQAPAAEAPAVKVPKTAEDLAHIGNTFNPYLRAREWNTVQNPTP
jgi:hypothetical protein